ncbi:MAG: LL-diaminopimelate aminotransferase [Bacteroidia bacterium]|nr:LL-diaminopimelate aminotransferase [Bacteroidia bacterium]
MARLNQHFIELPETYLFSDIAQRVNAYMSEHPESELIRMGIGDVTRPLPEACISAMHKAVDEMAHASSFKGYGPEQGYEFLIDKIIEFDYKPLGVKLSRDEVFVSDGAKSDTANISDILWQSSTIALTDPVYPVYVDSNVMAGRAGKLSKKGYWNRIIYLPCTEKNGFVPELPTQDVDVIYLCFPNNPTGTTLTREQLKKWVDYAIAHKSIILFDAAYEAFITEKDVPHSIYEIEGAEKVAIEFRSYSKTAGFTGTRCSYTVVPKECLAYDKYDRAFPLNILWKRRQCTKFNGTPYIIQRGAEAIYTEAGKAQVSETIAYYLENASIIRNSLTAKSYKVFGGINSPYIWLKTPYGCNSWDFFDYLLKEKQIVATPGVGFGPSGEGYIRLTSFNTKEKTLEAMNRI